MLLPPFPVISLSGGQSVVKAQVLAGGSGKGYFTSGLKGGVQKAERCACVRLRACVYIYVYEVCVNVYMYVCMNVCMYVHLSGERG